MTEPEDLKCHPAAAWALMKKGQSIRDIALRFGDLPRDLDAAIWAWRARLTGSEKPAGVPTMQALGLKNLAPFCSEARRHFRERA